MAALAPFPPPRRLSRPVPSPQRQARGRGNEARGRRAEAAARDALVRDGWSVLGERVRTEAGEVDLVCERAGLVAFVEVKSRPTLYEAAFALTDRQQARLCASADILLARNPHWGPNGARHDLLVVDREFRVRRIADAFRAG